eukprot:7905335-Pyramimonas_sp.AAC.1
MGHGAAVCDKSLRCKVARKEKEIRRGHLLRRDLTYSANVAEGSGGREKMIIPGSDMCKLLLGKGAGVLDLMKTPSGHLALGVDE